MRAIGPDDTPDVQILRSRVLVRGNRLAERELSEVLENVVNGERSRVAIGPRTIARREGLDRECGQAEQVITPIEHHVDGQVVASVDSEAGPVAVTDLDALPLAQTVERRVFGAGERRDVKQPLGEVGAVDPA